ncbi:MAG: EF-hand domain-containing protein [Alphaproteobacteria bacterium]
MYRPIGLGMVAALMVSSAAVAQERHDDHDDFRAARFVELLDTDGDGTVSLAEILAEHRRLFAAADLDGNGTLSVEEFRRRGRLFQSLGTATLFDMMDTDGDRSLSADEIDQPSRRWFSRYDVDGDGAMAAPELSRGGQAGGADRRR